MQLAGGRRAWVERPVSALPARIARCRAVDAAVARLIQPHLQKITSDVQKPPTYPYGRQLGFEEAGYKALPRFWSREEGEMAPQTIKESVLKFVNDEDGMTVVEYAVAGGLITAALATAFTLLGGAVATKIMGVCTALNQGSAC